MKYQNGKKESEGNIFLMSRKIKVELKKFEIFYKIEFILKT